MHRDDIALVQGEDVVVGAVRRVVVPEVEEDADVAGAQVAGEVHHPVQGVDELVLEPVAQRLRGDEFDTEASTGIRSATGRLAADALSSRRTAHRMAGRWWRA